MNNEPLSIIGLIVISSFAIVGGLILYRERRKEPRRLKFRIGIALLLAAGITLFIRDAELRGILTAAAVVIAVFVAAFSFDESRRLRQDSIDRESRDRKERFLNEITGWLKGLKDRIFSSQNGTISKAIPEELDRFRKSGLSLEAWEALYNLDLIITRLNLFSSLIKEGEYIQKQASKLNTDLGNLMEVVLCQLKQRKDISVNWPKSRPTLDRIIENAEFIYNLIKDDTRPLEDIDSSEDILASIRLGRNTEAIKKSIGSAVDKSIDIKMSLLQS